MLGKLSFLITSFLFLFLSPLYPEDKKLDDFSLHKSKFTQLFVNHAGSYLDIFLNDDTYRLSTAYSSSKLGHKKVNVEFTAREACSEDSINCIILIGRNSDIIIERQITWDETKIDFVETVRNQSNNEIILNGSK